MADGQRKVAAKPNGLDAAKLDHKRSMRPKCLTCRNPAWAKFAREALDAGYAHKIIHRVLCEPEKYGQDFPPYEHALTTLQNHIYADHD